MDVTVRLLPLVLAIAMAGCGEPKKGAGATLPVATTTPTVSATAPSVGATAAAPRKTTATGSSARKVAASSGTAATPIGIASSTPAAATETVAPPVAALVGAPGEPSKPSRNGAIDEPAAEAPGAAEPAPFNLAAGGVTPDVTELNEGEIDGLVLAPGVYGWSSGVSIPADLTLAGGADDVWIFQVARDLVVSDGAAVLLSGGAQARNVFWRVGGRTTLGTGATVEGTILSNGPISLKPGAVVTGRSGTRTTAAL